MDFKQSNEQPSVYENLHTFYRRKYYGLRRRISDATRSGRGQGSILQSVRGDQSAWPTLGGTNDGGPRIQTPFRERMTWEGVVVYNG